jgi:hypothetical protein
VLYELTEVETGEAMCVPSLTSLAGASTSTGQKRKGACACSIQAEATNFSGI